MSSARDQIFHRLRQSSNQAATSLPTTPMTADSGVEDLLSQFTEKCAENRIEIHHVNEHNWTEQLQAIANQKQLKSWLLGTNLDYLEPAEAALSSAACTVIRYNNAIESCKDHLFERADASLTLAQSAIAETGTLVVIPSEHEPRLMSLIPEVHVVLLEASQMCPTLQGYISTLDNDMPTNVLFISSPSKTADIQQTLAYGAHGPKELVVLIKS